ncbi:hypothetical protein OE88DRAFT_1666343 [Heliocybe sulcata]|uniref:Uncharacterized protein n=1 Tax=Heliocybe sulcata TaxID=5364 RepID=A0A5C3MQK3_9AGAM|nr:hypothetical protein OE88DRAFT_1666343 [Heliocybe sulcata]
MTGTVHSPSAMPAQAYTPTSERRRSSVTFADDPLGRKRPSGGVWQARQGRLERWPAKEAGEIDLDDYAVEGSGTPGAREAAAGAIDGRIVDCVWKEATSSPAKMCESEQEICVSTNKPNEQVKKGLGDQASPATLAEKKAQSPRPPLDPSATATIPSPRPHATPAISFDRSKELILAEIAINRAVARYGEYIEGRYERAAEATLATPGIDLPL